jgi:DNA polymerase III delta prime subunit
MSTLQSVILIDPEASLTANPEPNTMVVDVLEGESGITTEQIRNLIVWTRQYGFEAGEKRAIVLQAQRWTRQAPQALLKTLEEPPADTTIILTTNHSASLPQTIRSRCATIPISDVVPAQLAAWKLSRHERPANEAPIGWTRFVELSEAEQWRTMEIWHKAKKDIDYIIENWEREALAVIRTSPSPDIDDINRARHLSRIRQQLSANASTRLATDQLLIALSEASNEHK